MATDSDFVNYVVDQIDDSCEVTFRYMFGGVTLYSKGKVVALLCDNQLFVKPTESGRTYIGNLTEAPAYPGSKPFFLIDEKIDDGEWLTELIKLTESELPKPKPRKKKKK